MSTSATTSLIIGLFVLPVTTAALVHTEPPKAVDFDRDVKTIFAKHCVSCHGPVKPKNGLRLDRKADAMAVIVPGKPADSLLFQLLTGRDKDRPMPPKGPLPAEEVATLRAWIEEGAKWPDAGSTTDPADWWSFRPLKKPVVPETPNTKHQTRKIGRAHV